MLKNHFESGQWNTICDRCGFKFKSGELRKTWDNFWVCPDDWEPRHVADFIKAPRPEKPIPWTRPEPSEIEGGPIYISESIGVQEHQLPPSTPHGSIIIEEIAFDNETFDYGVFA
jgi:hypothetical protein